MVRASVWPCASSVLTTAPERLALLAVSRTMPVSQPVHEFNRFPSAFEGLLPEGIQLEAMLRRFKLDRTDLFGQLVVAGQDLVGALTVKEIG